MRSLPRETFQTIQSRYKEALKSGHSTKELARQLQRITTKQIQREIRQEKRQRRLAS